jgi:hypothetical protein
MLVAADRGLDAIDLNLPKTMGISYLIQIIRTQVRTYVRTHSHVTLSVRHRCVAVGRLYAVPTQAAPVDGEVKRKRL